MNSDVPGFVYLMRRADGKHKIGRSIRPEQRRSQLAMEYPGIQLIHQIAVADMGDAERTLHKLFAEKRLRGEWFDLTDEDIHCLIHSAFEPPPDDWEPPDKGIGVMFNIEPWIYDAFKKHCEEVGRDMKTEFSFAILEHMKRGRRPLPPELQKRTSR